MKRALIVGASSGIGRELAILLVAEGYRVGVTGRREDLLRELQLQFAERIVPRAFDATEDNALQELDLLVRELGGLDLLVLSAGFGEINPNLDAGVMDRTLKLNVLAFTRVATWGMRLFEAQGRGQLVGITSLAGLRGNKKAQAYNASKAYQINFLEGLQLRAAKIPHDIWVTDIRPGLVGTDMAKGERVFWVAPPEKAVRQMYRAIVRKKRVVVVTRRWNLVGWALRFVPGGLLRRL